VKTTDVGSLPPLEPREKLDRAASAYVSVVGYLTESSLAKLFEKVVLKSLEDKVKAGVEAPNYPQLRDMNEMFMRQVSGVRRARGGYEVEGRLRALSPKVPELEVLRRNLSVLRELGVSELRACVTGPYTLSTLFKTRTPDLIAQLGEVVTKFTEASVFNLRGARVTLVFVDEPVLGFLDDPLLDPESVGREALLKAWEQVCHKASSLGAEAGFHLHTTANPLFWEVEHLKIIQSHVGDPIYERKEPKLEEHDKLIAASVCRTDLDALIAEKVGEGRLGEVWASIRSGGSSGVEYLEGLELMARRARRALELYGSRVACSCPECGLGSFPSYSLALECLRRASEAAKIAR